jgi:uncharacterized membrane protein YedE/YeeE
VGSSLAFVMIGPSATSAWAEAARAAGGTASSRSGAPRSIFLVAGGRYGIGWGLSGVCPGPGIVAASTLDLHWLVFVGSMLGGMALYRLVRDGGISHIPDRRAALTGQD